MHRGSTLGRDPEGNKSSPESQWKEADSSESDQESRQSPAEILRVYPRLRARVVPSLFEFFICALAHPRLQRKSQCLKLLMHLRNIIV